MTRTALPPPAPDPLAAPPLALTITGDVAATGDITDLHLPHHLHQAAHPPLAPDPALTLVATGNPQNADVLTTADMVVVVTAAPDRVTTELILAPTAAHPPETHTLTADATSPVLGLAPGLPATGAETGDPQASSDADFLDPQPDPTGTGQDPGLLGVLSV